MKKIDSEYLAWKIRRDALDMVHSAHASHIGSIFSCADIVAVLYAKVLNYDPNDPEMKKRDQVVLSKGHSGVVLYSVLAEVGFYPLEELNNYGKNGSYFSCHVSHKVPGIEVSTGSLGHGIGIACGLALDSKIRKKQSKVYCIVGDGECNEGIVWETAMLSAQHNLDNFTVVVDHNGMQALGDACNIINMDSMAKKWDAFGWHVIEVNGHSHSELEEAFNRKAGKRPKVIIAQTTKGKGVSFMENKLLWHYRDPQGEDYEKAVNELEGSKP